tara:strand:+ start:23 stop:463 length:441 start_codon:yes stop_codon:yes gene_type:complete
MVNLFFKFFVLALVVFCFSKPSQAFNSAGASVQLECKPDDFEFRFTDGTNNIFLYGTFPTGDTKKEAELVDTRFNKKTGRFTIFYKLHLVETTEKWRLNGSQFHVGIMETFFLPEQTDLLSLEIYDEHEFLIKEINCILPVEEKEE